MKLRPILIAAALAALLVPTLVSAGATAKKKPKEYASVALNVLPPGNGADGGPTSTDQIPLYDGLTPLGNAVTSAHLRKYFKPETFGLQGKAVRVEETGRKGLRIVRDKWGVPHVTGKTRSDVMYGAGWVTAEDRNLLMQLVRGPSRVAALDVPGLDAFGLALSGRTFVPSQQAEDFLASQYEILEEMGAKGRRVIRDIDAFVAGVNGFLEQSGLQISPWTRNDFVASAALIGGIFGVAGGNEVANSQFVIDLIDHTGVGEGGDIFDDLRNANDPDSPVTVPRSFRYGSVRGIGAGNALVRDYEPFQPGGAKLARHRPLGMSNALLIGARKSVSKQPIFVAGPQVGYFWPEFFLELDLHGGGIDTRGASFPGLGYVVIGRGKDYAWSAMSSRSDIVDTFVETPCGGDKFHYLYKGECREMGTFDAGLLKGRGDVPDQRLVFRTTVHGPVIGYAGPADNPRPVSRQRSTYGREVASALAFADLNANKVRSAQDFFKVMNQEEFSFNWVYADNRDIAFFSAARLPKRSPDVSMSFPTDGTGAYDWRGFEPLEAHARAINPPSGTILAWNNRPAKNYSAPDDHWSWGSVQRVQLLRQAVAKRKKHTVASAVGAMNQAATQDLRVVLVWPSIKRVLEKGTAPTARDAQMVSLLDTWLSRGGSRLDGDVDGKIDDPGAAIMDAAWPKIARAVMEYRLGAALTDRLARLNSIDDAANSQGSAYDSGWYSYVKSDMDALAGANVPEAGGYCGPGIEGCLAALWGAIHAAGDELEAAQGPNPAAWRADATSERIVFRPGLLGRTMRWTNRPTFQQVISFARHRPRRY